VKTKVRKNLDTTNRKTPQSGDPKSQPSAAVVIWEGGAAK